MSEREQTTPDESVQIPLYLSQAMKAEVEAMAKAETRSRNNMLGILLREAIDARRSSNKTSEPPTP